MAFARGVSRPTRRNQSDTRAELDRNGDSYRPSTRRLERSGGGRRMLHRPRDAHRDGRGMGLRPLRIAASVSRNHVWDQAGHRRHNPAGALAARSHSGQEWITRPGRFDCSRGRDFQCQPADDSLRRGCCCSGNGAEQAALFHRPGRDSGVRMAGYRAHAQERGCGGGDRTFQRPGTFPFFFSRSARCSMGAAMCCSPFCKRTS